MEDIQPDIPMEVKDVPNTQDVKNTLGVDNLTREMNRTSISRQKVSFMGPLRTKYKHTPTASEKESRRIRRLLLLRIIDGHPYVTIIESNENLKALDLNTGKQSLPVQDESGIKPLSSLAHHLDYSSVSDDDQNHDKD